ncbi:MAG: type IV secretory system conjugative DNA transfer family protein [Fimbriimonas sp.]
MPPWIGVRRDWRKLGRDPLPHLIGLGPEELRTHALVIGATGSGKTNLLHHLIAQDLARNHSVAVLDARGDLVDAAVRMCAGRIPADRVALFDLREKIRPLGFDPLGGPGEPYFRALGVLEAVATEADSWGVQLAETLRYALMVLAEAGMRLTALEALFFDREFRRRCLRRVERSPAADFWSRYDALSAERQQTLATPVLNKVSLLFSTKNLRRVLGHPAPVDLSLQVNRSGSVTLVSLAVDELHGAGRMVGNLMLSALCREAFARVRVPERERTPIRLYVDEFEHFLRPDFETILAEGRRFGLSLVLAHQTLAQLTPKLRSLILNNVGVKFAFRCGREDSAVLSKDITGDPQAHDLNALKTGEALLWVRDHGCAVVEINEPIAAARGTGGRVEAAYVDEIYALRRDAADAWIETHPGVEDAENERPEPTSEAQVASEAQPLGDWICG